MMRVRTAAKGWPKARSGMLNRRGQMALVALTIVLLLAPTTTLAEESWVSGWPPGQADNEITTLAVAPSDGRVIYASTSAALYRSTEWQVERANVGADYLRAFPNRGRS